jgi:hypothetical protein
LHVLEELIELPLAAQLKMNFHFERLARIEVAERGVVLGLDRMIAAETRGRIGIAG